MPLMSLDDYNKTEHATPYLLSLASGTNFLYYFGERHSFDPNDEQWVQDKKFWQEFLEKTQNTKRIVFVEGGKRPQEVTEEESIIKHGGMGLATFLAHQENINTYSPEPDGKYERNELEKEFSREEIQYYYFARVVHQWGRIRNPKPNFDEYILPFLENDKSESEWLDFNFSLEAMKDIHTALFQSNFDERDTEFFHSIASPVVLKSVINKVSRMSGSIRDEHIVGKIKEYISNGYSIFAQYGCSHVVIQEPLLREIL